MSVNKKLNVGFISILAIIMLALAILIQQFFRIESRFDTAINTEIAQEQLGSEVQRVLATQGMFVRSYILDPSESNLERFNYYNELLTTEINRFSTYEHDKQVDDYVAQLHVANEKIQTSASNILESYQAGSEQQALSMINNEFATANSEIYQLTVSMQEYQQKNVQEASSSIQRAISWSIAIAIFAVLLITAIVIFFMMYAKKHISAPLKQLSKTALLIADGNLSHEGFTHKAKDEIGQLSAAFNQMKNNLHAIIFTVRENTGHLSASAQQLAASTEEVVATSEEIAQRVTNSAEIAHFTSSGAKECAIVTDSTAINVTSVTESANDLLVNTQSMDKNAKLGASFLINAKEQMQTIYAATANISDLIDKLSSQSQQIGKITEVITGLTDQTNLLALNAAIEAARAGEHGKGFAVVADEVKKLAEQSKISATQIVDLTDEIQLDTRNVNTAVKDGLNSVTEGVDIIEQASDAFLSITRAIHVASLKVEEIFNSAEQVAAATQQVAASTHEIATGAERSTEDFEMIAAATEQQTATMAQLADVSTEVSQSAQDLQGVIQKFKL